MKTGTVYISDRGKQFDTPKPAILDEVFRKSMFFCKNTGESVIHSVHADFSEGILTIQSDPPMAFDFLQPPTYKDTQTGGGGRTHDSGHALQEEYGSSDSRRCRPGDGLHAVVLR